jgi:hypothetical protein
MGQKHFQNYWKVIQNSLNSSLEPTIPHQPDDQIRHASRTRDMASGVAWLAPARETLKSSRAAAGHRRETRPPAAAGRALRKK